LTRRAFWTVREWFLEQTGRAIASATCPTEDDDTQQRQQQGQLTEIKKTHAGTYTRRKIKRFTLKVNID
jgi:hypothetical protein